MSKPTRMRRRTWAVAWAVLCAAGLAATAALQNSSAPDPRPARTVSAECDELIAEVEKQLASPGSSARKRESWPSHEARPAHPQGLRRRASPPSPRQPVRPLRH